MVRPRQPIDLLVAKGNKHLTKEEIKNRKNSEVKAPSDKVRAPAYLDKELKKEFNKIAKELLEIGIISNLDIDALARFIIARRRYIQIESELVNRSPIESVEKDELDKEGNIIGTKKIDYVSGTYTELVALQDKIFKQCRTAASDLGLTISSRCKLVLPKQKEEEKPKNKFMKYV